MRIIERKQFSTRLKKIQTLLCEKSSSMSPLITHLQKKGAPAKSPTALKSIANVTGKENIAQRLVNVWNVLITVD